MEFGLGDRLDREILESIMVVSLVSLADQVHAAGIRDRVVRVVLSNRRRSVRKLSEQRTKAALETHAEESDEF
jgi:type II secretory pathway predicted ATPase ExeA